MPSEILFPPPSQICKHYLVPRFIPPAGTHTQMRSYQHHSFIQSIPTKRIHLRLPRNNYNHISCFRRHIHSQSTLKSPLLTPPFSRKPTHASHPLLHPHLHPRPYPSQNSTTTTSPRYCECHLPDSLPTTIRPTMRNSNLSGSIWRRRRLLQKSEPGLLYVRAESQCANTVLDVCVYGSLGGGEGGGGGGGGG